MEEINERDQIPVYPSSDRSYETYYNERIKKNSYDKENNWPFFGKNQLKINGKKIVGFSHLQNSLKFKKVIDRKIPNQEFMGIGSAYAVKMSVLEKPCLKCKIRYKFLKTGAVENVGF
uniref:Uncharacterized protein n=1 Tax=Panagrolaimus davidi TaxID=227884 RepID=A0A914Q343_9BILA